MSITSVQYLSNIQIPSVSKLQKFFFCGTFHKFSNSAHNTYSCIGTSGKNCQIPHEGVLVKTTAENIWNKTPITIKQSVSLYTAKKAIKDFVSTLPI